MVSLPVGAGAHGKQIILRIAILVHYGYSRWPRPSAEKGKFRCSARGQRSVVSRAEQPSIRARNFLHVRRLRLFLVVRKAILLALLL
jgi:hypothetical protein